jgi:hypothetical protein
MRTVPRSTQALELVEPGEHAGDGLVDVVQLALVVVAEDVNVG